MHTKSCIYGGGTLNRIRLKQAEGYIHGFISIKTSENNIVSFNVFQNELTRNDKISASYKLMQKVMDDYNDSTSLTPDKVEIQINDKYPNGYIRFKFDEHFKNINWISKAENPSNRIIFKIYGLMVNDSDDDYVNCTAIDYEKKLSDVRINNNGYTFESGVVYDIVGVVKEGLVDGVPINKLVMSNARKSKEDIDFSEGIKVGEQSPF